MFGFVKSRDNADVSSTNIYTMGYCFSLSESGHRVPKNVLSKLYKTCILFCFSLVFQIPKTMIWDLLIRYITSVFSHTNNIACQIQSFFESLFDLASTSCP